uniref:Uncharacterized protein n=1 Tax=Rhizophagus irregularis (strain DAOM 181602 / DAOM 197198 / MUCL 43194) TaxID=747089 RepID=U9UJL6_RHIID
MICIFLFCIIIVTIFSRIFGVNPKMVGLALERPAFTVFGPGFRTRTDYICCASDADLR